MNKIVKKVGIAALTASMLFGVIAFAACDKEHTHSLTAVEAVAAGCDTDGNTKYYECDCGKWFEDEAGLTEITDKTSVVVKAAGHQWDNRYSVSEDGTTKTLSCINCDETKTETITSSFTITYNFNYDGAPAAEVIRYEGGVPAFAPQNPVNSDEAYLFGGWYLEANCETKYTFTESLTENTVLYAKWKQEKLYVFEAEYTKLKGLKGVGWSNDASGLDMLMRDTNGSIGTPGLSGASNGYYVGYLYKNGLTLTFKINSDAAVDDATLILRVSGEMKESIILTGDEYVVKVNDNKIDYSGISITGIDPSPDAVKHSFEDIIVTATLSLVEGENIITLTTNNGIKMGGTATATAPLVDCIKIQSSSVLNWSVSYEENLDGRD